MTRRKRSSPPPDPDGIFAGMVVFLTEYGVQRRRLEIWLQKLIQMGATVEENFSKRVTHLFAMNLESLQQEFGLQGLSRLKSRFKGVRFFLVHSLPLVSIVYMKTLYFLCKSLQKVLGYEWVQESLKLGQKVCEDPYIINLDAEIERNSPIKNKSSDDDESSRPKKTKVSLKSSTNSATDAQNQTAATEDSSSQYSPPDLNRNITEIFGKLINIYRALGEDRRSFSYYKAIPVIEKLPFKIESVEQVKHLPTIGKAMQDHINEIVTTGKLSKLEHFETDEKVRTISLFGEVWGIGPATAQKLYDKGYRSLEDLKNEESLTNAQKLGLKYFDDIKTRIPRHEVQEMELLLQKAGEDILPGVMITCGGSYRRGKATCGDMDIIITHPDGKSHVGFLPKYVKHLKEMNFVREDLVFSIHSEEGSDSGVDTYFGLCTYPGRELRHRIDLKVYPRSIYAFGLIHWTGNDVVNRRMRIIADTKGFKLDDTGLFPATKGSGDKRGVRATASLKFDTEKEVFEFLGFPWLEPSQRNL